MHYNIHKQVDMRLEYLEIDGEVRESCLFVTANGIRLVGFDAFGTTYRCILDVEEQEKLTKLGFKLGPMDTDENCQLKDSSD